MAGAGSSVFQIYWWRQSYLHHPAGYGLSGLGIDVLPTSWIEYKLPYLDFKLFFRFFPTEMSIANKNISYKLASLRKSKFRSKFRLQQKDRDYIAKKGLDIIKNHAFQFIEKRVAPELPKNDGKQTPMRGHPVFIAQHATATCCRKCIQKWHGIEKGRVLNREEIEFIQKLIMEWIDGQLNH